MIDLVLESTLGRILAFASAVGLVAVGAQEFGVGGVAALLTLGFAAGLTWRDR
jgi:hypothetical protein